MLAVAALGGCCGPVTTGGLSGLVSRLVPEGADRDRAYALDAATYNAVSVAAPAVVSGVAVGVSSGAAVALLGAAAAGAAALAAGLPYGPRVRRAPAAPASGGPVTLRADLAAGTAAVWRVRELRAITAATCLAFAGIGGLATTAVLLTEGQGRPGAGGVLMTAFAAGALASALAAARRPRFLPARHLVPGCLAGAGLLLAAAAAVPSFTARAALFAAAGVFNGPLPGAALRLRADHAPPRVRTQVFTVGAGLKISAAACGAALAGVCAALPPPLLLLGSPSSNSPRRCCTGLSDPVRGARDAPLPGRRIVRIRHPLPTSPYQ
ncbi:hypothetical protein V1L54_10065 [Streptomyces sp. TRM 70361]|uniref:hypothetical protein n=1 Tax=Streptomyces sp. TRM 70361 TaxID=3116553 RepID=UPI002E7B752F|nr:hypothetical protein [Streptomyces sp. TRM 70361]MEE1939746.1 hypothetical protein [Streptomyces sp. TRM 70361]